MTTAGLSSAEVRNADRARADHLSPLDFTDRKTNSYRSFLNRKLGLTPFDCGRVVDDSSLGPEGIVSVYSQVQNGRRVFYVSSVEARANIWQRSNSMRDIAQGKAVGVRRVDAEIHRAVARHISDVWLRMLRDQRPFERSRVEFELAGYLQFSIQQTHGTRLEGELWLPPQGPKTRGLVILFPSGTQTIKSQDGPQSSLSPGTLPYPTNTGLILASPLCGGGGILKSKTLTPQRCLPS